LHHWGNTTGVNDRYAVSAVQLLPGMKSIVEWLSEEEIASIVVTLSNGGVITLCNNC